MTRMAVNTDARSILALLDQKHSKDVFVPECKDGSTVFGGHLRMDAWAMKKSWTSPVSWAYEIKVSRSDFLRDDKWPGYLGLCNQFYFVCPWGLIDPSEVDDRAGLMYAAKTGTRLIVKKKAPHRDVDIPDDIYRYILMSRCQIVDNWHGAGNGNQTAEFWRRWMEKKEIDHEFGRRVSSAIRERVREEIEAVRRKQHSLELRLDGYAELERFLESIGIDPSKQGAMTWLTKQRIQQVQQVLTDDTLADIKSQAAYLNQLADRLDRVRSGPDFDPAFDSAKKSKGPLTADPCQNGAPGRSRTSDLLVRSQSGTTEKSTTCATSGIKKCRDSGQ